MSVYLVVALVLLLAVLFLVLRPFLLATVETVPLPTAPAVPAARARAAASVERAAHAPRPEPAAVAEAAPSDADVVGPAPVPTADAPGTDDPTDVRARVEAAIAARKAALRHRQCSSCQGTIEEGDAFCRSCGTRVAE